MFERIEPREKYLDIKIGNENLRLVTDIRDYYILQTARKYLRNYLISTEKIQCKVKILTYPFIYRYPWPDNDLERFRSYFLQIHQRFPSDHHTDRVDISLRILQYMNPEDESIRHIHMMIDDPYLIYAQVGMSLFFLNVSSKIAYIFVGEAYKRFFLFKWIMQTFAIRQSAIWTGVLNGVMFILSHLFIQNKGLLLHGTALLKDNQGLLFLGLSGTGKSTITQLIEPTLCFSDDGAVIKIEENQVVAYYSPFRQGSETNGNWMQLKAPIQKIFLLEKADQNSIVSLKKSELMDFILKHMIHFYKFMDRETALKGFYIVHEILENLPIYRLRFTNRQEIWDNNILRDP